MNRISDLHKFVGKTVVEQLQNSAPKKVPAKIGTEFFLPHGYVESYEYPLIIWLHHNGGSECEVREVMPHISTQNFIAAGIRGNLSVTNPEYGERFGWSDSLSSITAAEQQMFRAMELAFDRFSVNPHKVFLAGYAEGGTMALRLALRFPSRFAGVVSLGGPLPNHGRIFSDISAARELPILLSTFRDSQTWPVEQVCRDVRALNAAKLCVSVRQYLREKDLCTVMLEDVNRWIMSEVTGSLLQEASREVQFSYN